MPADLIVYGLIAAGLIFWLRSILGTKHGEERPFLRPDAEEGALIAEASEGRTHGLEVMIEELMQNPKGNMAIANRSAELALLQIARNDRHFDVIKFLRAAQDVFEFVVEAFADGDRDTLRDLLSPSVFRAFDLAIENRLKAGQTMKTEIIAIDRAEIIEAHLDGRKAFVTVRFFARENSTTYDKDNNLIAGNPEVSTKMRDVWTFSRDLKGRDPRWLVAETREDGEGDSEVIPNAS